MSTVLSPRILFKGGTILSMDRATGNLEHADLLVEGKKIVAIGHGLVADGCEIIDASDTILMPGFVDAHRHAWQGALRQLMPNVDSLEAYVHDAHLILGPHYRPEDHYIGNLLTALGSLDAGTTTIVDASHNSRSPDHADASIDALQEAGIRALHMPGKPLAGAWAQHWPADLERLKNQRFSSDDQLLTLGVFAAPDLETWSVARKLGLRMLTEFLGPMAPMLDTLREHLGPDNIFNHCTALPEEAWRILADSGVSITVDPRSDAQYSLADGVFAWQAAVDHGIRPGIGTDLETAYGGDMPTELRVAFSLQRAIAQSRRYRGDENAPAPIKVEDLLQAATIDGARAAGLDHRTGSLTVGKEADLILIRTDTIGMISSNNVAGAIIHAADRSNIDSVMVAGRFRKRNGKLLDLDLARLKRLSAGSVEHLFSSVGHKLDRLADSFGPLAGDAVVGFTGL
jgi:cytosine/adenosine deaminase-related metal-dependent hydrolase